MLNYKHKSHRKHGSNHKFAVIIITNHERETVNDPQYDRICTYRMQTPWGTAVWEVRSVNQRYLETYIRLPEQFRGLEPSIKERFRKALQRGKVECQLRFTANDSNAGQMTLNKA